jgi:hypothetical protein
MPNQRDLAKTLGISQSAVSLALRGDASSFCDQAGVRKTDLLYESFESETVARTGRVPMPSKKEKVLGGHALLIVGFKDDTSEFIVRNSWSASFGDGGYIYLPYAYVSSPNLAQDFWVVRKVSGAGPARAWEKAVHLAAGQGSGSGEVEYPYVDMLIALFKSSRSGVTSELHNTKALEHLMYI